MFYKGVNLANTQEATRSIVQTISDDIQFYNEPPDVHSDYFCIGDHRYSFNPGVQVGSGDPDDFGIVREVMSICKPWHGALSQPPDLAKAEKLLDPQMQLNRLSIKQLNGGIQTKILVVYYGSDKAVFHSETSGHDDPGDPLYDSYKQPDAVCTGSPSSSQFCATADYQTTILQKF